MDGNNKEMEKLAMAMDEIMAARKELNSTASQIRKNWDALRTEILKDKLRARRLGFCHFCREFVRRKILKDMYLNAVTIATNFLLGEFRCGDEKLVSVCPTCMKEKVRPIHPYYPVPNSAKRIPFGDNQDQWEIYPIVSIEGAIITYRVYSDYQWGKLENDCSIDMSERKIIDDRIPIDELLDRKDVQARFSIPPKFSDRE